MGGRVGRPAGVNAGVDDERPALGEDAFVGAGAVVTRDVPPRVLVVGNPARFLREVPADELLEPAP